MRWLLLVLCGLWCGGVHLHAGAAAPIRVVDDRGAVVQLAAPARRIVSLLPSLTEMVCDLGACERVVATDRWSNWPARIQGLPKVGGLDDPQVEAMVAQRPDLVLVSPASRLAQRLRGLGLTVAELDAQDLRQVRHAMGVVATLLGVPERAELRWRALMTEIDAAAAAVPTASQGQTVYFEVSSTPYAAGEASFIGQLLSRLGARHVVSASLGPFPKLNPEFVVRADPALIMVSAKEVDGLVRRPGWRQMRAIQQGRVCPLDAAQLDVLSRPGPRLGQGARVLARCLAGSGRMR